MMTVPASIIRTTCSSSSSSITRWSNLLLRTAEKSACHHPMNTSQRCFLSTTVSSSANHGDSKSSSNSKSKASGGTKNKSNTELGTVLNYSSTWGKGMIRVDGRTRPFVVSVDRNSLVTNIPLEKCPRRFPYLRPNERVSFSLTELLEEEEEDEENEKEKEEKGANSSNNSSTDTAAAAASSDEKRKPTTIDDQHQQPRNHPKQQKKKRAIHVKFANGAVIPAVRPNFLSKQEENHDVRLGQAVRRFLQDTTLSESEQFQAIQDMYSSVSSVEKELHHQIEHQMGLNPQHYYNVRSTSSNPQLQHHSAPTAAKYNQNKPQRSNKKKSQKNKNNDDKETPTEQQAA